MWNRASRCFIGLVCIFVLPGLANASLKSKIQKRLNSQEKNVRNVQYEPYYVSQEQNQAQEAGAPAPQMQQQMAVDANYRAVGARQAVRKSCAPASTIDRQVGNFIVYNVSYVGTLEDNVVTVNGEIVFEVFDHPTIKRTEIPLVNNQVGLIDVQVNRGKSYVMSRGNKYYLVIDKPGRYTLDIEYLLKVKREREGGPGSFSVDVMPAPISQFEFVVPSKNVQVFIEPAIKVETEYKDNTTEAWAVMPNTSTVQVRWTKALPKTTIEKVELEPKVYAETATFVSIGGGVVQASAEVQYSILQAEVSTFRLALPEDVSVLSVNSKEMRDWKVSKKDKVQYLDVFLNFGTKGKHVIDVAFERNIDEGLGVVEMPWIRALNVERENGFYGIAASTNLEVEVGRAERVTRIDSKQLPQYIWRQASRPILLAFKYLNHPFAIDVELTRHEEIPVLVAAIDSAYPETLLTKDGKALTKLMFNVRNNVKQYLRVKLPETAVVWSSFVNGDPVKPAKDKEGNVLIPLKKSNRGGDNVTQFPVEIVYLDKAPDVKGMGQVKLKLPKVDLPINQMDWRVYLPDDFIYFGMKSDGDIAAPHQTRGRRGRYFAGSVAREMKSQVTMEQMSFAKLEDQSWGGDKVKGLLPIKIDLPKRGDAFRVSKMLVVEGDQPWMSIKYVPWGSTARGWMKFFKIIAVVAVVFWLIKRSCRKRLMKKKKKQEAAQVENS